MAWITCSSYTTWFRSMLILAVAPFCGNEIPAILLNHLDCFSYFHLPYYLTQCFNMQLHRSFMLASVSKTTNKKNLFVKDSTC